MKVRDGSLHISGKHHPGALVLRMGEVDLETELVGQSSEIPLATRVLDTQALFIDDTSVSIVSSEVISDPTLQGIKYWKVSSFITGKDAFIPAAFLATGLCFIC